MIRAHAEAKLQRGQLVTHADEGGYRSSWASRDQRTETSFLLHEQLSEQPSCSTPMKQMLLFS